MSFVAHGQKTLENAKREKCRLGWDSLGSSCEQDLGPTPKALTLSSLSQPESRGIEGARERASSERSIIEASKEKRGDNSVSLACSLSFNLSLDSPWLQASKVLAGSLRESKSRCS